ncbi:MAG: ABC transporter ATP-binding protein [Arenimonas sp.]|nr:ABC transporter ATP-binding protein [Arenimonas sp.]
MTVPVIDIRGLGKVYAAGTEAEVVALKGVDLRVMPGEFIAIMGASGSGKSTLMNVLGCLDADYAGEYFCDGVDVRRLDKEQLAKLRLDKIGFVFQSFNLLSRMDALHNVMMPLGYAGIAPEARRPMAETALTAVGLGGRMGHRPGELSGGQQQRIAIARALVNRPPMILADEPTGALDSKTGAEILALFEQLKQQGHTIVLITHDEHVAAHADRVCLMRDGVLTESEQRHVA